MGTNGGASAAGPKGTYFTVTGDGACANPCTANCATCATATTCTTCNAGFRVEAGLCVACGQGNCNTCNTEKPKCDVGGCATGYQRAANGNCVACAGPLKGVFFTATAAGSCASCGANCGTCATATTCLTCSSGFVVDGNGKCQQCTVGQCATCDLNTRTTLCTSCKGKYAISTDKKSCAKQCDAHATSCKDANKAQTCDTKNKYYLSTSGRCLYCDVANAGATTKGNMFFDGTYCGTCDKHAVGCATLFIPADCATGYAKVGNDCVAVCAAGKTGIGYAGSCPVCDANVWKGKNIPAGFGPNGGGATGACASQFEAFACAPGFYVNGAGAGSCCKTGANAAVGVFGSVSTVAGLVTAVAALLQ